MTTELFGWLTLTGFTLTTLLYLQNQIDPTQTQRRVNTHCTIGKLTLLTAAGHLLSQPSLDWNNMLAIWTGIGFLLLITASGVILLYLPEARGLRYHARSIHPAMTVGMAFTVIHHLLTTHNIL